MLHPERRYFLCAVLSAASVTAMLTGCASPTDDVETAAAALKECYAKQTRSGECPDAFTHAIEIAVLKAKTQGITDQQIMAAKELGRVRLSREESPYRTLLNQWRDLDAAYLNKKPSAEPSHLPGLEYARALYADLNRRIVEEGAIYEALGLGCTDERLGKTLLCKLRAKSESDLVVKLGVFQAELQAVRRDYLAQK